MFSYYGSKTIMVDLYPPPKEQLIIEPFAGAAKYALKYWDRDVIISDTYEKVYKIWVFLQNCSKKDISSLPTKLYHKQNLDNFSFDCEEQKWLMGFVIAAGDYIPRKSVSNFCCHNVRPNRIKARLKFIEESLFKIKHWTILNDTFEDLENRNATWFIDPPYQHGGQHYIEGSQKINYKNLANWIISRRGHIIACENTKADWMDFKPMKTFKGTKRKTTEAIWSNFKTAYDNNQVKLF